MTALRANRSQSVFYLMIALSLALPILLLQGCVAQQADMKQTERAIQQKLKQHDDQLSQLRARQSQELSTLRERLEELEAKRGRPVDGVPGPLGKDIEAKIETHDELISSLLVQIADISKRLQTLEKK